MKTGDVAVETDYVGGSSEPRLIASDGRTFTVGETPLIIGRSPQAGVVINDSNVSRQHAEVWRTAEGVAIRDLRSTNGTFVNGHRIDAVSLSPRDDITVGTIALSNRVGVAVLAATTNYAAVVRPLQVLVMVDRHLVLRAGAARGDRSNRDRSRARPRNGVVGRTWRSSSSNPPSGRGERVARRPGVRDRSGRGV